MGRIGLVRYVERPSEKKVAVNGYSASVSQEMGKRA
jgi:hypothetical protein